MYFLRRGKSYGEKSDSGFIRGMELKVCSGDNKFDFYTTFVPRKNIRKCKVYIQFYY